MRISSPNCPAKAARIAARDYWRNRNIPQVRIAGFVRSRNKRIAVTARPGARLMLSRRLVSLLPSRPIRWKRQHVRRSRFATIRAIPARHFGVRDQADGNGFGGQAKGTTSAHEEFSQVSRGNADIALAIHDHETRCCALIDGVPIGSMGHADVRAARDVIANSIAPHLPRAFFAARALGFDRAAGACLCAA